MADQVSKGPYQIAEIDIHLINEVFRQIQLEIDELRGLSLSTNIAIGPHTHATSTTGTGSGGSIAHSSLSGVTTDQHHAKSHTHDGDGSGTVDASAVTYTPAGGLTDPGDVNDALDQLANANNLDEGQHSTHIWEQVLAGTGITITISEESGAITLTVP